MKLLNPFSVELRKEPFMEIKSNPIYSNGEYHIYKYVDKHYLHAYKNIIIAERSGIDKELLNNLATNTMPAFETTAYFGYNRAKLAIEQGLEASKKLDFKIINSNQLELF